jgi:hypothetical protein
MAGLWKTNKNKHLLTSSIGMKQGNSPPFQIRQTEILSISKPPGYAQAIRSLVPSVHPPRYYSAFNFISEHIAAHYLLCQPNKTNFPVSHFYSPSLNLYIFTFSVSRTS